MRPPDAVVDPLAAAIHGMHSIPTTVTLTHSNLPDHFIPHLAVFNNYAGHLELSGPAINNFERNSAGARRGTGPPKPPISRAGSDTTAAALTLT